MSDCQNPADGSVNVVRLSDLKQPQVYHTQIAKASHFVEQTLHGATAYNTTTCCVAVLCGPTATGT
jgi:hypothetical protein